MQAGVSPETVYADFGCKRAILASVAELAVLGDEGSDALEVNSVRIEPDPARKVDLLASLHRAVNERSAAVLDVVRTVAESEPEVADLLRLNQQQRLARQTDMMAHFSDTGALRPGLSVEDGTDLYWIVTGPEVYHLLVRHRGWDSVQYQCWVSRTLCRLLLEPEAPGRTIEAASEGTGSEGSGTKVSSAGAGQRGR
jgi:hypothetical protein